MPDPGLGLAMTWQSGAGARRSLLGPDVFSFHSFLYRLWACAAGHTGPCDKKRPAEAGLSWLEPVEVCRSLGYCGDSGCCLAGLGNAELCLAFVFLGLDIDEQLCALLNGILKGIDA
jgi:hypothetical protein